MHEKPCEISIHALRKESDGVAGDLVGDLRISIHALRKESDHSACLRSSSMIHFNPRSP